MRRRRAQVYGFRMRCQVRPRGLNLLRALTAPPKAAPDSSLAGRDSSQFAFKYRSCPTTCAWLELSFAQMCDVVRRVLASIQSLPAGWQCPLAAPAGAQTSDVDSSVFSTLY